MSCAAPRRGGRPRDGRRGEEPLHRSRHRAHQAGSLCRVAPLPTWPTCVDACDSIEAVLRGVDLALPAASVPIRSAVEREFIIIGEAVSTLAPSRSEGAAAISHARMIVGFRNQLAHEYATIDDETVCAIAQRDVPVLRRECVALLETHRGAD